MNNKFCNRFYESRLSPNLKSKTCGERGRTIENLKWLGLSVVRVIAWWLGLRRRRSNQRKCHG